MLYAPKLYNWVMSFAVVKDFGLISTTCTSLASAETSTHERFIFFSTIKIAAAVGIEPASSFPARLGDYTPVLEADLAIRNIPRSGSDVVFLTDRPFQAFRLVVSSCREWPPGSSVQPTTNSDDDDDNDVATRRNIAPAVAHCALLNPTRKKIAMA